MVDSTENLEQTQNDDVQMGQVVGFSLAELAGFDATDVAVLKSRLPAAGNYTVKCTKAELSILEPKEPSQKGLPQVKYAYQVADFEPTVVDPDADYSRVIGKTLNDTTTLWPDELAENIGLLKGKYVKVGLNEKGPLGGVKGLPPGFIDGAVDNFFRIRVRHYESKGEERAAIDWVGPVENLGETA